MKIGGSFSIWGELVKCKCHPLNKTEILRGVSSPSYLERSPITIKCEVRGTKAFFGFVFYDVFHTHFTRATSHSVPTSSDVNKCCQLRWALKLTLKQNCKIVKATFVAKNWPAVPPYPNEQLNKTSAPRFLFWFQGSFNDNDVFLLSLGMNVVFSNLAPSFRSERKPLNIRAFTF